jgi:hypothetical protein
MVQNLDGWDIRKLLDRLTITTRIRFRVEDGMIRIVYDEYKTFDDNLGTYISKRHYSHYIFNYEYRFTGNQTQRSNLES